MSKKNKKRQFSPYSNPASMPEAEQKEVDALEEAGEQGILDSNELVEEAKDNVIFHYGRLYRREVSHIGDVKKAYEEYLAVCNECGVEPVLSQAKE